MLLELLITLTSGLLIAIVTLVIGKIVLDRFALVGLEKRMGGMPVAPGASLLGNHSITLALSGENCKLLKEMHDKLGTNISGLKGTRPTMSTTDLDLMKTIVLDEPGDHLERCPCDLPLEEFEKSIMLAPRDEWRQLRRVIAPALASNKFKTPNVVEEIETSISNLINHIERQLDSVDRPDEHLFDWDNMAHKFSLDVVFRCFYKQYDEIDFDNPHDSWTETIDETLNTMPDSVFLKISLVFPMFRKFVDWLIWHFTAQGLGRKRIALFVRQQARLGLEAKKRLKELEREAKLTGVKIDPNNFLMEDGTRFKRNMIDHIIDQFHEGKISQSQYFNNASFLLGAADKTATDCIVHTVYLLATNQEIQNKSRMSIANYGIDSEYLDWVLKESLRLLPPAPVSCSRTVTRDIKLEKSGYFIPSGTFVHPNAYVVHRLKEYWGDDAEEFRPERWSDTSKHHPMQYIPFGAGIRGCPGKQFALFEMKMLLAALLKRYKFECEPREDAYTFKTPLFIFVVPNSPTKVTIKRLAKT